MPKREALKKDAEIKGKYGSYSIVEEIGRGASCIAYKGSTSDNNRDVIIKELFPRMYGIKRSDKDDSLCADTQDDTQEKLFTDAKKRFRAAVDLQRELRKDDSIKNSTFEVQDCFEANKTLYAVTDMNSGISLEKKLEEEEFGVLEMLKTIKAVTILIGEYHEQGYLYMDIKPQNIFIIPETNELVKLYDFDTVVSLDEIKDSGFYSYTEGFAAPEVESGDAIDGRSDLYSIGSTLYYCIFRRTPSFFDNHPNASFCFDQDVCKPLFKRKNPALKTALEDILRKTLCGIPDRRYKNAKELEDALNKAIEKAEANAFLLSQELRPISRNYIKRAKLMEEIKGLFQNTNAAFLYGLGGIGKSEAAKEYARTFSKHYRHVQMQEYCQSLEETVARLEFSGVDEIADTKKMCENKLRILNDTPDDEITLIIIDNYNPAEMPKHDVDVDFINNTLACIKNVDFLFTTWFRRGEHGLEIKPLDENDLFGLFFSYYTLENKESREQCRRLIGLTDGHTLTIELVARLAEKKRHQGGITLAELVDAVEKASNGIESIGASVEKNNTHVIVNKMIEELFDLLSLENNEKTIMRHAALLPSEGIEGNIFSGLLGFGNYDDFLDEADNLLNLGWLRIHEENDKFYISVHPVVADVAVDKLKPTVENCEGFLRRFKELKDTDGWNDRSSYGFINTEFLIPLIPFYERMQKVLNELIIDKVRFYVEYGAEFDMLREYGDAKKRYEENMKSLQMSCKEIYEYIYSAEHEEYLKEHRSFCTASFCSALKKDCEIFRKLLKNSLQNRELILYIKAAIDYMQEWSDSESFPRDDVEWELQTLRLCCLMSEILQFVCGFKADATIDKIKGWEYNFAFCWRTIIDDQNSHLLGEEKRIIGENVLSKNNASYAAECFESFLYLTHRAKNDVVIGSSCYHLACCYAILNQVESMHFYAQEAREIFEAQAEPDREMIKKIDFLLKKLSKK